MSFIGSTCQICDATVPLPSDVQVSEMLTCPDCGCSLVVAEISRGGVRLEETPEVEENQE